MGRHFSLRAAVARRIRFWRRGKGLDLPGLSREDILNKQIAAPPLPEQRAIAAALSDADALIAALDDLIRKKRAMKQGAIQHLLTGSRRLPGFKGKWKDTTLGQCAVFLSGGTPSKRNAENWGGTLPWLTATDMKTLEVFDTQEHLSAAGAKKATCTVTPGTTLILVRGMTLLKDVPICVAKVPMAFNQDVKAIRVQRDVAEEFIPWLLLGGKWALLASVDVAGHGTGRLATGALARLRLRLPEEDEQRAVAAALYDMDAGIAALEQQRRKMRAIKQGMMQALLTGRVRLVTPSEGTAA